MGLGGFVFAIAFLFGLLGSDGVNVRTRFDIFLFLSFPFFFFWMATTDVAGILLLVGGGGAFIRFCFLLFWNVGTDLLWRLKKERRGGEVDRENQKPDLHLI